MNNKFLLFGGSGFIGHHLTNLLNKQEKNTAVFDLEKPINQDVLFEQIDVRKDIITEYKPTKGDVIFNLAAVHRTPGHTANEYFETNLLGAQNVCNYARKYNINTIIFTSSIATYGTYESQKSEGTIPTPDIPYGISKLTAEYIHKLWQQEKPDSRKLIITRPGVVFGKYEKGNFTRLINSIAKKRFLYPGRKDTVKACIYVKDLTEVLIKMIDNEPIGVSTYNLTYEPAPNIEEICNEISKKGNLPKPKIKLPPAVLLFIGSALYKISRKEGVHPDRVKKLMISNNINGQKLNSNYTLKYGLESGIIDWMKETDFLKSNIIY